jgi:hypothetical protein
MMEGKHIPFTREDEKRIVSTGLWGMIAAIVSVSSAALGAMISLFHKGLAGLAGEIIGLAISAIMGVWLIQASRAFLKVAQTDEADEHYLLLGFIKLRLYFMLTGILIIIAIGLVVLVALATVTCMPIFLH